MFFLKTIRLALFPVLLTTTFASQMPLNPSDSPLERGPLFHLFTVATSGNPSFSWHQIWSAGFTVTSNPLTNHPNHDFNPGRGVTGDTSFFINSTGVLHDLSWNPWGLAEAGKGDAPGMDRSVASGVYGHLIEVAEGATAKFVVDEFTGEIYYEGELDFGTFTLCALKKEEAWGTGKLETQLGWRSGKELEFKTGCADVKLIARYLN